MAGAFCRGTLRPMPPRASAHRVLVAGGGVAALEAMVALRRFAEERVDIELLAPDREFCYRPLAVAEPFAAGEVTRFDLASLAAGCGCRHRLGALVAVDPERRRARTTRGDALGYDSLLVAVGARQREALPRAFTFRGPDDSPAFEALLDALVTGEAARIVFAVPSGVTWPLPLYELALQTGAHVHQHHLEGVGLTFVTPEERPLGIFGPQASDTVAALLAERGVHLLTSTYPEAVTAGSLRLLSAGEIPADAVVALPRLTGIEIAGLPHDADGFLHVDELMRVTGADDVYAAGDGTSFPVKQGGLATQQADVAAASIARAAGAPVEQPRFDPVLRGLLLTGGEPRFLRAELEGGRGQGAAPDIEAPWWPPAKIAGRYLGPYLAERSGFAFRPPWLPADEQAPSRR